MAKIWKQVFQKKVEENSEKTKERDSEKNKGFGGDSKIDQERESGKNGIREHTKLNGMDVGILK